MTRRERFFSCVRRNGWDSIPMKHEYGTQEFHAKLYKAINGDQKKFRELNGDVFGGIGPSTGPLHPDLKKDYRLRDFPPGSSLGRWGEVYAPQSYGEGENAGTYGEAIGLPFAGITDVSQLKGYPWPSPDWFDYSKVKANCHEMKQVGLATLYRPFSFDFMNNIARTRGVEQVMVDIGLRDPVFLELVERRFQFHYETDRRTLEAAAGEIDVVHFCEDLGSQRGPLIGLETFDELFAPYFKKGFELAHKHGALTMMHVCGGVRPLIPRLIDIGLDILDVVQVSAAGMAIEGLKNDFGKDLVFCGSMCVQSILADGTPSIVRREVERRLTLFKDGGLILGPTHCIQPHTPVENVLEMYRAAGYPLTT